MTFYSYAYMTFYSYAGVYIRNIYMSTSAYFLKSLANQAASQPACRLYSFKKEKKRGSPLERVKKKASSAAQPVAL